MMLSFTLFSTNSFVNRKDFKGGIFLVLEGGSHIGFKSVLRDLAGESEVVDKEEFCASWRGSPPEIWFKTNIFNQSVIYSSFTNKNFHNNTGHDIIGPIEWETNQTKECPLSTYCQWTRLWRMTIQRSCLMSQSPSTSHLKHLPLEDILHLRIDRE